MSAGFTRWVECEKFANGGLDSVEAERDLPGSGKEQSVKKGRHRRFDEARSLKRSVATESRNCPECGAEPEDSHASWCLATEDEYDEILGTTPKTPAYDEDDPLNE